ncbi:MAG: hypothetical protein R6U58_12735 [Bacteroidales bacterium]
MKPYLWTFILWLFLVSGAYSQPSFRSYETRSSGFSLNLHWMQFGDKYFSPLRYNGPGGEINILSVRNYGDIRRHLRLGAKTDYMWNSLDFNAVYIQPVLGGGLSWVVNDLSTKNAFSYIGANLSGTSRFYRFLNEDPDHIYWATSYTLDLYYLFDIEFNKDRKAVIELTMPVAGIVSRPAPESHYTFQLPGFGEYVKRLHENIGFATFNNMQAANLRLITDLSRTRRYSVSMGYEMDFARFSDPRPVIFLSNSLLVRFYFDVLVW